MNRLQLSNQLQNQCNNIEIAFAGADMILIVHFHVWPEIRPLGFKGLRFVICCVFKGGSKGKCTLNSMKEERNVKEHLF